MPHRFALVDLDRERVRLALWSLGLGLSGFGFREGLVISKEQEPCYLSTVPPTPSLALALQGDSEEMCPELVDSCEAHGAEH